MSDPKNIAPAPTEGDLDSRSSSSITSTIASTAPSPTESDTPSTDTLHPKNKIALFCTLHPSSPTARSKVLSLLDNAGAYYRSSKSQCTTWSYFVPSTRPKAPSQLVPKDKRDVVIGGMEIYTDKQALSTQQNEPWFVDFAKQVKDEGLYGPDEELVVWYPAAGFVSRSDSATPFGKGTVVMIAIFTCKDGQRSKVVDVIGKYTADWVEKNEPNVLTYCTMTRPKAPNQVLLFERYSDHKALGAHGSTKQFKAMFKGIAPHIEVKQTKLQEFMELDNAFVGNVVGQAEKAKL